MMARARAAVDPADSARTVSLRERCVRDVALYARGGQTAELDAWLASDADTIAERLVGWFGDGLPSDRSQILLALDRDIAAIDALLSDQVNAILHAGEFQRMEARWRGLQYIAEAAAGVPAIKIRMLTATWGEVVRDLERASDFDQSHLYQLIYTQEFGTLGGEPMGLLVGDYEVQHVPGPGHPTDDAAALKSLAAIAAASFAPIVMGVSPRLFQLDSFHDLGRPFDLRTVFRQPEYMRWQQMRQEAELRFVGLVMPRILMRLPYQPDMARNDGFHFVETVHRAKGADYLWGNGAFAFASVVLRAFANFGWFADIRGAPRDEIRGGLVTDLPVPWFATDTRAIAVKPSMECALSDTQEKDLSDLGFIALRRMPFTSHAVFYANQSLQIPARYDTALATVNARLSSMLQYMLCVSRFAHYIKVLGRNCIGSMMTADEVQQALQRWLMGYCEASDDATFDVKARHPLREGAVEIRETPGKPGAYSCKVFLRPHFQLDDIATGFRLTTELAPPTTNAA